MKLYYDGLKKASVKILRSYSMSEKVKSSNIW